MKAHWQLQSARHKLLLKFPPKYDSYGCLQCVMAYGELLEALPSVVVTCFEAPPFPESVSPLSRRSVRRR